MRMSPLRQSGLVEALSTRRVERARPGLEVSRATSAQATATTKIRLFPEQISRSDGHHQNSAVSLANLKAIGATGYRDSHGLKTATTPPLGDAPHRADSSGAEVASSPVGSRRGMVEAASGASSPMLGSLPGD